MKVLVQSMIGIYKMLKFKQIHNNKSLFEYYVFLTIVFFSRFIVNKWLSPTKDDKKLFIELNREEPRSPTPPQKTESIYLVTVQTGDVQQTGTNR